MTCRSPVPVSPPESVTWKRTVPDIAEHVALTIAETLPLLLVTPVTIMPVAVPPAICVTVNKPAGVSASAAVPIKLLELGGVPCCRVSAEAGVNVGGEF